MNPKSESPDIYKSKSIPEYLRITFTRCRLSSHRLKIETRRWSRIPSNQQRLSFNINPNNLRSFFEDKNLTEYDKSLSIYHTLKVVENDK